MKQWLLAAAAAAFLAGCAAPGQMAKTPTQPAAGARAQLAILETTDIHSNVMSYDYYKLAEDKSIGLERAATLVHAARKEFPNTLLFDAGDTIQGTVLADYEAQVKPIACGQELAVYKAMDTLGYDAGTIGNHEFNYGLSFLSQATGTAFDVSGVPVEHCKGPNFPLVLSNVFSAKDGKPLYAPWKLLTRTIRTQAADGKTIQTPIRIGVLGFTPTWILDWDKRNLDGKVTVMGPVEAAQKYLPEVKAAGADIVVAICHCGLNPAPYTDRLENVGWHLAGVAGIDVLLLGHSHDIFPNPQNPKSHYANMPEVDNVRGFVRGVPAAMGNYFGRSLGVIELALAWKDGRWQVDRAASKSEVRSVKSADGFVAGDEHIEQLVKDEHEGAIAYVKTPIGRSDYDLSTYFVAAGDTSALALVNAAERNYAQTYIKQNLPQYAALPVLGAASPFKAGFGGPNDYTDVPAGTLAINNAADLYLYPNTLTAVKVNGAGVKAWLEKSAGWFHRIDPSRHEAQELVNTKFPTYNFDVLQGDLTWTIDVTRAAGQRIADLRYRGKPVHDDQDFIVVTNNYRASGGGGFPGLDGSNIVFSAPDTNRDALIGFVREQREITRRKFGDQRNWHFAKVKTAGPVVFTSAAGKLGIARAAGLANVALFKDNGDGSAVYSIDLSR
ncbi:MAG: bifunctional 2',3'-cyclic-nucleotide 2'-phosphodiesterase/3'-nucleotidase [Proteobacteria bacterium]|uniref:bifunctional 2',3'-cyclic-nucleotide 2'-phosphodiesterase/3'-nucleotidase n=1 Tax=Rudaea sp. TaxID=2136325 RepID=UPI0037847575|nr:bifunctional 2',3'-cyclic-nucleotide 2'-phosphodiesterase/3'-nucleotidase [Pseudomonadota bacterium]